MCNEEKYCKKVLDKSYRNHRILLQRKLKKLRSNPKVYWKLLNKSNKSKFGGVNIQEFYHYFKDINVESNKTVVTDNNVYVHNDSNTSKLNDVITNEEILSCVKSLKNKINLQVQTMF